MQIERRDFLRFSLFFCGFFALGFLVVLTFFPASKIIPFYDSSSIKNKEELPEDFLSLDIPVGSGGISHVTSWGFSGSSRGDDHTAVLSSAHSLSGTSSIDSWISNSEAQKEITPTQSLPKITFRFRPDTVQIDSKFPEYLQNNLSSSLFASKIPSLLVTVDADMTDPRGKLVGNELVISPNMSTDSEFIKVLVHEMGHVIDIRYLTASRFQKDPSEAFYAISWLDYEHKKQNTTLADFVSGYALSNKYEDFAESFAFFVFHNQDFAVRAVKNNALREKYDFFANRVFQSAEFSGTSFENKALSSYDWDVTKIPIDTKKYLFYLK